MVILIRKKHHHILLILHLVWISYYNEITFVDNKKNDGKGIHSKTKHQNS